MHLVYLQLTSQGSWQVWMKTVTVGTGLNSTPRLTIGLLHIVHVPYKGFQNRDHEMAVVQPAWVFFTFIVYVYSPVFVWIRMERKRVCDYGSHEDETITLWIAMLPLSFLLKTKGLFRSSDVIVLKPAILKRQNEICLSSQLPLVGSFIFSGGLLLQHLSCCVLSRCLDHVRQFKRNW